jgi:hypothetical protein
VQPKSQSFVHAAEKSRRRCSRNKQLILRIAPT